MNKKKIFIGIFIAMITVPWIIYPFLTKWLDTDNYENRELAVRPILGEIAIREYPSAYENYFNDHLPFKNQIRSLNSAMDVLLFHSLDSDKVILGKEGWLFYKAEGCLEDYRGLQSYTEAELAEMKQNLQTIQKWFEDRGIEVVINIVPNKDEVYAQYMPEDIQVVNSVSKTEQAVAYLNKEIDMPIIYDLDNLKEKTQKHQIYCKYDTHWNYIGGYYGAQTIGKAIGKTLPEIADKDIVKWSKKVLPVAPQQRGDTYDLSMMISLPHVLDVHKDKKYMVKYKPDVKVQGESLASYSDVDTMEYTSKAEDDRHLVMIGDSFSNLDMPYLAKEFQKCSGICYLHYENNYITSRNPDIVVFQFVERRAGRFDQTIMGLLDMEE